MKHNNSHIIFDFDGVLCDSQNLSMESYSVIREKHFPILPMIKSKVEYASIFSGDPDSCLYKWLTPNETKCFYEEQTKFSLENSDRLKLFEGISNLLMSIPKSQVSVLTTNLKISVEKILSRELGNSFLFDELIFSKDLGKPKSEMFKLLIEKRKTNPANTFYVCDSEADIKTCNAIKINSIAVAYGYFPIEILKKQKPSIHVTDVVELSLKVKNILRNDFKN